MAERIIGQIRRVNGPVIEVKNVSDALNMELIHVGESKLIGEVIKLHDDRAVIQVYEDATGLAPEDNVYGSGGPLSVELGPGMLGTIYDGIQRPLDVLRDMSGSYIEKGINAPSLSRDKKWHFVPNSELSVGSEVKGGQTLGTVQETSSVSHKIMVPPDVCGILKTLAAEGDFTVDETAAVIDCGGIEKTIAFFQKWPIRVPPDSGCR